MNDDTNTLPPEAWPIIGIALNAAAILALVWALVSLFVYFRRRSSNLTPVQAARRKKADQPDFLSVDHARREAALERADAFEDGLERREAEEARAAEQGKAEKPLSIIGLIARIMSLVVSLFSLGTVIFGTTWQISRMGSLMKEYSTFERITSVIASYPVSSAVAALVIGYHIWLFIKGLSSKSAA
jgi:hypothetical protein